MKVRVFYNVRPLGWFKIGAITLFPFIFVSLPKDHADKTKILAHEFIHIQQVLKIGWFKFYLSYLLCYTQQMIKHGKHSIAYYTIPYEIEAYRGQDAVDIPESLSQQGYWEVPKA